MPWSDRFTQPGRAVTAGSRGGGGASGRSASASCWVPASGGSAACSAAAGACSAGSASPDACWGAAAASAALCWHWASHSSSVGMMLQTSGRYTTTVCSRRGGPGCRYWNSAKRHHLVQVLKSMPVWACAQRMAVRTSTCGSAWGSRPSREGDHSPPTSTASSSFRPSKNLICFRGCSGVSLGSAMSSTNCRQQRYSSSKPGEESSRTLEL